MAVENIVAEHQRHAIRADKVGADDEGIRQASRLILRRIGKAESEIGAIAQQPLEQRLILRR